MIKIEELGENLSSYSVTEDATSLDPGVYDGGVGQLTFTLPSADRSMDTVVTLSDTQRGRFQGVVRNLDETPLDVSVTVDGIFTLFNSWHTVVPYNGTLAGYITLLADTVGITNTLSVETSIASSAVIVPGYVGNVWDNLKQFLGANQWEIAQVFDQVVVRPIRLVTAITDRVTAITRTINSQTSAQKVDIEWSESSWGTQVEVFPIADDAPIVVNAGETVVQTYTLNASLLSVNQPVLSASVLDQSYAGTNGVYAVAGNDGLPIATSQWTAQGGSLSVRVTEDPSVIEVTVVGASMPDYAPFRIAMIAGTSNYYNALHITGTGLVWTKHTLNLVTGSTTNTTGEVTGTVVINQFIQSYEQAFDAGLHTAAAWANPQITLAGSATSLNRTFDNAAFLRASFELFNTESGLTTIDSFNTAYAGLTFGDFNAYWNAQVSLGFTNQLFGQGIGARFPYEYAVYRITQTTTDPYSVGFNATIDTTMEDFNTAWNAMTFADFNTQFAGYRLQDFNPEPLRNEQ